MTIKEKFKLLISVIKKCAEKEHCYNLYGDDFDLTSSGNYDDTFGYGAEYGEICFARTLLEQIGEPFTYPNIETDQEYVMRCKILTKEKSKRLAQYKKLKKEFDKNE
jgi:hypothetical protein